MIECQMNGDQHNHSPYEDNDGASRTSVGLFAADDGRALDKHCMGHECVPVEIGGDDSGVRDKHERRAK